MNIRLTICMALAMLLMACSESDQFVIEGEVAGNPTMNLYVRYYGNNAVMQGVTAVKEGKFEFAGRSAQPTLVEITDNEYHVLGRLYLANGQRAQVRVDRLNPFKMEASGTPVLKEWSDAARSAADTLYAGSPAAVNAVVESYIAEHPQSVVSAMLFATCYDASLDPVRADSVLNLIDPEARPQRLLAPFVTVASRYADERTLEPLDTLRFRPLLKDSTITYVPADHRATLLVLTNERSSRPDSIVPRLKELKRGKPAYEIVDLVLCSDSAAFRRTVRRDTADWTQGWLPGGAFAKGIDRLAIPAIPYYIVADSAGRQIYRGNDLDAAIATVQ